MYTSIAGLAVVSMACGDGEDVDRMRGLGTDVWGAAPDELGQDGFHPSYYLLIDCTPRTD
jgi:hypothetical protein